MALKTPMQKWEANNAVRKRIVITLVIMCAVIESVLIPFLKVMSTSFSWQFNEFLRSAHYLVPIIVLGCFLVAACGVWFKDNFEMNEALKQSAWE